MCSGCLDSCIIPHFDVLHTLGKNYLIGDIEEYLKQLEEKIITRLAEVKNIGLDKAMSIYYESEFADKICEGKYGIQYLDYKVLVDMLLQAESAR